MYSLPTLAPQDSHTLWYTSASSFGQTQPAQSSNTSSSTQAARRSHADPSQLALLRAEEAQAVARKHNIQNYGSSWIKPPGVSKTLFQQREEKREAEEHAEAMRREALATELAAAEMGEDEMNLGMEMEGEVERDLDEEVPEADATGDFDDDDEEEDEEDEEEEEDEEDESEINVPQGVPTARVAEDAYREALMRGSGGLEGALNDENEDGGDMLQESDLISTQATHYNRTEGSQLDMDMEVDLDAEVPDAEEEYEHTDTDEEISSSEESSSPASQPHTGLRYPPSRPSQQSASSMVRSDGTQNSMDMGSPRQFQGRRSGY